jgi:hypothetical protein
MPLDANPLEIRGAFLFDNGYALAPPKLYLSHFSSCPNADEHRRR